MRIAAAIFVGMHGAGHVVWFLATWFQGALGTQGREELDAHRPYFAVQPDTLTGKLLGVASLVVLTRRYANGLTGNAGFTLNRVTENRTVHEFDREPTLWQTTNNGRPWRVTGLALYESNDTSMAEVNERGLVKIFRCTPIIGAVLEVHRQFGSDFVCPLAVHFFPLPSDPSVRLNAP